MGETSLIDALRVGDEDIGELSTPIDECEVLAVRCPTWLAPGPALTYLICISLLPQPQVAGLVDEQNAATKRGPRTKDLGDWRSRRVDP
jgi:hypothetical protein